VFYPILFSIDPFLLLITGNLSVVPIAQIFPSIIIALFSALFLFWLISKWLKDIHRAGFVTYMVIFWFFHYGIVYSFLKILQITSFPSRLHWFLLPLWTAIPIILSSKMVWRKITSPQTITLFLNIMGIAITGYSILRISMDVISRNISFTNYLQDNQIAQEISPATKKTRYILYYPGWIC